MWNAWACQGLSKDEKDDLKKTYTDLTIPDWTEDLQKAVNDAFAERLPGGSVPDHNSVIDFKGTNFERAVGFSGFLFLKYADFRGAQFMEVADFMYAQFMEGADFMYAQFTEEIHFSYAQFKEGAYFMHTQFMKEASFTIAQFMKEANFSDAQFKEYATFINAQFTKEAYFKNAQFTTWVSFRDAQFTKGASFSDAQFKEGAHFSSSRFEAHSYFQQAIFSKALDFTDASFAQPANFRGARFEKYYPILEGTNLHGKTTLTAQPKYWPKATDHSQYEGANTPTLESAAAGCAHLRHNMTAQGLPDDAHFFFRREMGCKLAMAGGVKKLPLWLYGKLSDYGYSYGRPLGWLIQLWLVWTLVYTPYFLS